MVYLYFSFAVVFMLNIFWAKVKYVAICCKVVFVYLWLCVSQIWSGCTFILICCYETLRAMAINDLHPDSYFRLFFCNSFIELSSPFDLWKFFFLIIFVACPLSIYQHFFYFFNKDNLLLLRVRGVWKRSSSFGLIWHYPLLLRQMIINTLSPLSSMVVHRYALNNPLCCLHN